MRRNLRITAVAACTLVSGLLPMGVAQSSGTGGTLHVTVDDVAWANRDNGTATVTGTVSCSGPSSVKVSVDMSQKKGDKTVYADRQKEVTCNGFASWTLTLNPYSNTGFTNGLAGIDARATATGQETADTSKTVGVKTCTIIGTTESETIHGTSRSDIICGLAGADVIYGAGRGDVIRSYKGRDEVHGGAGPDRILGGFGGDLVNGGPGHDQLDGDEGDDYVSGGRGNDSCLGGTGTDHFTSCETTNQNG